MQYLCLMLVAYLEREAPYCAPLGFAPARVKNNRLGLQYWMWTNALAYSSVRLISKKKVLEHQPLVAKLSKTVYAKKTILDMCFFNPTLWPQQLIRVCQWKNQNLIFISLRKLTSWRERLKSDSENFISFKFGSADKVCFVLFPMFRAGSFKTQVLSQTQALTWGRLVEQKLNLGVTKIITIIYWVTLCCPA